MKSLLRNKFKCIWLNLVLVYFSTVNYVLFKDTLLMPWSEILTPLKLTGNFTTDFIWASVLDILPI